MKKLVIIGAGGCGREVLQWAKDINKSKPTWGSFEFIDDNLEALNGKTCDAPLHKKIQGYQPEKDADYICCIAKSDLRKNIVESFEANGAHFINIIHPTAVVSSSSKLGKAVVLYPFSIVSDNALIEDGCIINMYSSVAHDSVVGEYSTISAHCDITGMCKVGKYVFMGTSSQMIPSSRIGDNAYICAGSMVMGRVKENTKVMGNPARKINI